MAKIKCVLQGTNNMVEIINSIHRVGYPTNQLNYENAHRRANGSERRVFGERKFKELLKVISEVIPNGELAGSHDRYGNISVSKKIPEKWRDQVVFHEFMEHLFMKGY